MAFPTAVNDQITDAVTQANVKVLGDAPAMAMGNLYQATAQALSNAAHNATTAQQQSYITSQAATTMGVATLYSIDTASTGVATTQIFGKGRQKTDVPTGEITPNMIIGHIQTLVASPMGKKQVQNAVEQARQSGEEANDEILSKAIEEIKGAIQQAREEGATDQGICYTLHQVAHDLGLNMLYPAQHDPDLTEEKIHAYYQAIIADYRKDNPSLG